MTTTSRAPTERELEIMKMVAQGLNREQMAAELHLALNTVRSHLKFMFKRYDVHNQAALVAMAYDKGYLVSDQAAEIEQLKRTIGGLNKKIAELSDKLIQALSSSEEKQQTINRLAGTSRDGWPNAPRQGRL